MSLPGGERSSERYGPRARCGSRSDAVLQLHRRTMFAAAWPKVNTNLLGTAWIAYEFELEQDISYRRNVYPTPMVRRICGSHPILASGETNQVSFR